ncbi:g6152 [Coccomyxa viridis]|uniref:G6152 protein n=1 Tax=Coccomyxa viridis TaxID=1274662 RepID=A0ABP1FZR9_9CHLO
MRGNLSAQSDPNKDIARGNMASLAMRASFSDADQRQTQRRNLLQVDAARDEYLLNLFRRADQNCTHQVEQAPWQPNGWTAPNMASRVPQPNHPQQNHLGMGQMGAGARPTFNLPGYPAHGPLPLLGNPANAGSQEPHKVDAAGSEGRLSNLVDMQEAAPDPAKIKAKLGQKAYTATRDRILRHMETFVEDIYDLHRLTRRQHHLEGILEDRERYVAELHRLTAPSAEPEGPEAAAEPEGAAEAMKQQESMEPPKDAEVPESTEAQRGAEPQRDAEVPKDAEAPPKEAEARVDTELRKDLLHAGVQKDAEVRKDREISTERKGSNEPIMPVEELLGTALSSESLPEPAKQLIASAGANSGDGLGGLQQAFGRGMRQASAQDLEKQHQNMAAAQEQMKQSMAAAQQAQQHSMELAAQQQHQHHQSMAAAYGQGMPSGTPFQASQDQRAAPQGLRLSKSQRNLDGGGAAAGGQQETAIQPHGSTENAETGGFSVIPEQRPMEQPNMASAPEPQFGMPWNGYPPYINPYQSFPNPMSVQVDSKIQGQMGGFGGYNGFNQPFYPGFNSFNNSNQQGYGSSNIMGQGGLSFDPMFAWYAHHYGRGAAQAQAQAQAHAQAQQAVEDAQVDAQADAQAAEVEDAAAARTAKARPASGQDRRAAGQSRGRSSSQAPAVHWWQDPQAAFGPAVPALDGRDGNRDVGVSNSTSKHNKPASRQSREHEEWVPPKQRMKRHHATSKGAMTEATGQTNGTKKSNTFGSGGSAFQKVAQRPRGFRALQRADSVGSENSRSRSSIGAAPGRRHTDAASPPEQLQSAANILAGLSGQRPS